jgi:hypothetical protein
VTQLMAIFIGEILSNLYRLPNVSFFSGNGIDAGKPTSPGGGGKVPKEATCMIYGDIESDGKVVYAEDGAELHYGPEFGEYEGLHTGSIRQAGTKTDGIVFKHYFEHRVLRIAGGERIGKPNDRLSLSSTPV